jgi:hypothetical protein
VSAFKHGARDAVHSVHDVTVVPEDDWVRGIHFGDQPGMLDDLPNRWHLGASVEPTLGIDLVD